MNYQLKSGTLQWQPIPAQQVSEAYADGVFIT